MNPTSLHPAATLFALRLHPAYAGEPRQLTGCLEHVLSGRRREFDDAQTLLACLAEEARVDASGSAAAPVAAVPMAPIPAQSADDRPTPAHHSAYRPAA